MLISMYETLWLHKNQAHDDGFDPIEFWARKSSKTEVNFGKIWRYILLIGARDIEIDRPKSVRNCYVIEVFEGVFYFVMLLFLLFCW